MMATAFASSTKVAPSREVVAMLLVCTSPVKHKFSEKIGTGK